jgi:hypothetical protein
MCPAFVFACLHRQLEKPIIYVSDIFDGIIAINSAQSL